MIAIRKGVRAIECPFCLAAPDNYCVNLDGKETRASHPHRWEAYRKLTAGPHEDMLPQKENK